MSNPTVSQLQLLPGILDLDHLPTSRVIQYIEVDELRDRLMAFKAAWYQAAADGGCTDLIVTMDLALLFNDLADIAGLPPEEIGVRSGPAGY